MFNLPPTLTGNILTLIPLQPDHFDDLYAVAADPLIWEQHPRNDRYQKEVFREFFHEGLASGGALLAQDAADGRVIGSSRFHAYDPVNSEIEIGWSFLARSHWGGVYNSEMKRLMLRHAFEFVDRAIFVVDTQNLRSQRAVEKIGGVRVGSRPGPSGRWNAVFAVTRPTA